MSHFFGSGVECTTSRSPRARSIECDLWCIVELYIVDLWSPFCSTYRTPFCSLLGGWTGALILIYVCVHSQGCMEEVKDVWKLYISRCRQIVLLMVNISVQPNVSPPRRTHCSNHTLTTSFFPSVSQDADRSQIVAYTLLSLHNSTVFLLCSLLSRLQVYIKTTVLFRQQSVCAVIFNKVIRHGNIQSKRNGRNCLTKHVERKKRARGDWKKKPFQLGLLFWQSGVEKQLDKSDCTSDAL